MDEGDCSFRGGGPSPAWPLGLEMSVDGRAPGGASGTTVHRESVMGGGLALCVGRASQCGDILPPGDAGRPGCQGSPPAEGGSPGALPAGPGASQRIPPTHGPFLPPEAWECPGLPPARVCVILSALDAGGVGTCWLSPEQTVPPAHFRGFPARGRPGHASGSDKSGLEDVRPPGPPISRPGLAETAVRVHLVAGGGGLCRLLSSPDLPR